MWWNVEEVQREWGSFNSAKHNTQSRLTRASIVVAMLGNYNSERPKARAIVV
jgi:hypothetical protein